VCIYLQLVNIELYNKMILDTCEGPKAMSMTLQAEKFKGGLRKQWVL